MLHGQLHRIRVYLQSGCNRVLSSTFCHQFLHLEKPPQRSKEPGYDPRDPFAAAGGPFLFQESQHLIQLPFFHRIPQSKAGDFRQLREHPGHILLLPDLPVPCVQGDLGDFLLQKQQGHRFRRRYVFLDQIHGIRSEPGSIGLRLAPQPGLELVGTDRGTFHHRRLPAHGLVKRLPFVQLGAQAIDVRILRHILQQFRELLQRRGRFLPALPCRLPFLLILFAQHPGVLNDHPVAAPEKRDAVDGFPQCFQFKVLLEIPDRRLRIRGKSPLAERLAHGFLKELLLSPGDDNMGTRWIFPQTFQKYISRCIHIDPLLEKILLPAITIPYRTPAVKNHLDGASRVRPGHRDAKPVQPLQHLPVRVAEPVPPARRDHPQPGRNPGQELRTGRRPGTMVRDLQHITADSPGRRPQLLFPGSIAGKKDTVRTGNQPDNPRVLILPSFLIFCGCFYNLYYTLFFAYFLVCLHFVYNFSVLSKLFQSKHFCYCFSRKSISSSQIGGGHLPCGCQLRWLEKKNAPFGAPVIHNPKF